MSPREPSVFAFSVTTIGRPNSVIGPGAAAFTTNTLLPPVPTLSAIVNSSGIVSGEISHTARDSDEGSMRAYILTMFSYTIVLAACPFSAGTAIAAGLPAPRNPSGWPAPLPVMNAESSSNASTMGQRRSISAEKLMMLSWSSSFGTTLSPVSFFASRVTLPNRGSASVSAADSSAQYAIIPPNSDDAFDVTSIVGNGTLALSIGTTVARDRTTADSSATSSSWERSRSGTRNPPSLGTTDEAALRISARRATAS